MANVQVTLAVNVNGIIATYIIVHSLTAFEALSPRDISLVISVVEMGMWGQRDTTYTFSMNNINNVQLLECKFPERRRFRNPQTHGDVHSLV